VAEVVQEGVPDDPAGGVEVHNAVEVEGPLEVELRAGGHGHGEDLRAVDQLRGLSFLEIVHEVLDVHDRGLAAQGDGRDVVLLVQVGQVVEVAELLREGNDVGVDTDALIGGVLVAEADVLVGHEREVFDHGDDVLGELLVLVGLGRERAGAGQRGLDVHVPVGADQFVEGLLA